MWQQSGRPHLGWVTRGECNLWENSWLALGLRIPNPGGKNDLKAVSSPYGLEPTPTLFIGHRAHTDALQRLPD